MLIHHFLRCGGDGSYILCLDLRKNWLHQRLSPFRIFTIYPICYRLLAVQQIHNNTLIGDIPKIYSRFLLESTHLCGCCTTYVFITTVIKSFQPADMFLLSILWLPHFKKSIFGIGRNKILMWLMSNSNNVFLVHLTMNKIQFNLTT